MIGRLTFGEMRLRTGENERRFYVDAGFVQVAENVVSILTNLSMPAEQVNAEAAHHQLHEALQRRPNTPEALEIRDRLLAQARAQLRITHRSEHAV